MGFVFLLIYIVWAYWAGRIASDHGLSPGRYRALGFFLGPIGVLLSVGLVRRELRQDHIKSGSSLPIRSLPGWGVPIVVSVLVLGPLIGWYAYQASQNANDGVPDYGVADTVEANITPTDTDPTTSRPDAAGAKTLFQPAGVAVDAAGNVFVADGGHNRVVKVPKDGPPSTVASGIRGVTNVAVDLSNRVYAIGETGTWKVSPTGADDPVRIEIDGQLPYVPEVAFDRSGNMFVPNYRMVMKLSKHLTQSTAFTVAGDPKGIARSRSGALVTADSSSDKVFEHRGSETRVLHAGGRRSPLVVGYDAQENIYVAYGNEVVRLGRDGTPPTTVGSVPAGGPDTLRGMAVDAAGNVYVTLGNQLIEWPVGGGQKVLLAP